LFSASKLLCFFKSISSLSFSDCTSCITHVFVPVICFYKHSSVAALPALSLHRSVFCPATGRCSLRHMISYLHPAFHFQTHQKDRMTAVIQSSAARSVAVRPGK